MAKSQEEQERELMLLNAQLDQQISAVEQHADSVLQKQNERVSSSHVPLVAEAGSARDVDARRDEPPAPQQRTSAASATMSPKVHRAVRASAARYNPASSRGVATDIEADKQNLNQRNQIKVQKLEITQLRQELAEMKEECKRLAREKKAAERDHSAASKHANELKRQLAKLTKDHEDVNSLCQKLRAKNKDLGVQVSQLRRDVREQSKDARGLQTQQKSGDVRLNRALAEVARLKEKLAKQKDAVSDVAGEKEERLLKQEKEIRLLERQRAELLGAFKKQLKLIDILKRQKMHIEAARLLSFTEEEFMKAIDHS